MLLRLSNDLGRAKAITGRYFKLHAESWPINAAYLACFAASVEKGQGKKTYVVCPAITPLGDRGSLLVTTHPAISTQLHLITPDSQVDENTLRIPTSLSEEELRALPYHFKVGILPHGHMS